jgi:hypothetical protein
MDLVRLCVFVAVVYTGSALAQELEMTTINVLWNKEGFLDTLIRVSIYLGKVTGRTGLEQPRATAAKGGVRLQAYRNCKQLAEGRSFAMAG